MRPPNRGLVFAAVDHSETRGRRSGPLSVSGFGRQRPPQMFPPASLKAIEREQLSLQDI